MKPRIQKYLEKQVKKYFAKHKDIKLIVVVGSVGKTSTKNAIATVLREKYHVRVEAGNHNTHISVPLAILGVDFPVQVHSPLAWVKALIETRKRVYADADVDVVIQELGTDAPGDIAYFGRYLKPDVAVVTSVAPEHMEFFKTLDDVAREELSVAAFSKLTIVNRDDVAEEYAKFADTHSIDTYGSGGVAEYYFSSTDAASSDGYSGLLHSPELGETPATVHLAAEHLVKAAVAAAAVGIKCGLDATQVASGMAKITATPGRMNLLRGVNDSTIIDDSYNSSPLAVEAALQTLYTFDAPQRIAILGSMNELGTQSPKHHADVGAMCDPGLLAWVVTVGAEAEAHLAPAAAQKGCQVRSFASPYDAGAFVHKILDKNAVVLVKGSQNGVFTEEAAKMLLHSTNDESKLVRQSPAWLAKKRAQFTS